MKGRKSTCASAASSAHANGNVSPRAAAALNRHYSLRGLKAHAPAASFDMPHLHPRAVHAPQGGVDRALLGASSPRGLRASSRDVRSSALKSDAAVPAPVPQPAVNVFRPAAECSLSWKAPASLVASASSSTAEPTAATDTQAAVHFSLCELGDGVGRDEGETSHHEHALGDMYEADWAVACASKPPVTVATNLDETIAIDVDAERKLLLAAISGLQAVAEEAVMRAEAAEKRAEAAEARLKAQDSGISQLIAQEVRVSVTAAVTEASAELRAAAAEIRQAHSEGVQRTFPQSRTSASMLMEKPHTDETALVKMESPTVKKDQLECSQASTCIGGGSTVCESLDDSTRTLSIDCSTASLLSNGRSSSAATLPEVISMLSGCGQQLERFKAIDGLESCRVKEAVSHWEKILPTRTPTNASERSGSANPRSAANTSLSSWPLLPIGKANTNGQCAQQRWPSRDKPPMRMQHWQDSAPAVVPPMASVV